MNIYDYLQIVSLVIFLAVFSGRTIWLKRKGTVVFRFGGKKGFPAFLEKLFLIFFPLWLLEIFIFALDLKFQFLPDVLIRPFPGSVLSQVAGICIIIVSIFLFIGALVSFKASWRIGIDQVAPGGLMTTGIFAISRNPVFLSMNLYFLGTFLIYANLFFLLSFICMAFGFHFQIREEEKFLCSKYGAPYFQYMTHVRRYI